MARILIVEDDKYLNKLVSDRFMLEGYEVSSALDGETAFEFFEKSLQENRPYEFVISDMLLPRMMGAQLFQKIHDAAGATPVKLIAISGVYKSALEIDEITKLYGLDGYWTKPFDISELIASLSGKPVEKNEATDLKPGQLTDRCIERLYLDAYHKAFTGKLILKKEDIERRIYFSNGFPVSADSTSISESLGQSLLHFGLIDEASLNEASRRMVEEKIQFGQMLIKMGKLTKEQLFDALRRHTYRLLLNSFLSRDGAYEFQPLKELPSHILALEFNSILLILKAHKAMYKADFLTSLFETKQDYFCLSQRAYQILALFNLDSSSLEFLKNLPPDETLKTLLEKLPKEAHETMLRVLYVLETVEFIEWSSTPTQRQTQETPHADFRKVFENEKQAPSEVAQSLQAEYVDLLNKDYFEILEVTPEASLEDIEESYRATRYRLHPDRFGGAIGGQTKRILDDMLGRIDKAYQTLADSGTKQEYLEAQKRWKQDSVADSKRFLEAQDLFREGLKYLTNQDFGKAKDFFARAHQRWDRGIEYSFYLLYSEFKFAQSKNDRVQCETFVNKLKALAQQHRSSDIGFLLLGHCYQAQQQYDLARDAYLRALENNEKNDEASLALARIGDMNLKKQRVNQVVKKSQAGAKKILVISLLLAAIVTAWLQRNFLLTVEQGITELETQIIQDVLPAVQIRQKAQAAKIKVKQAWLSQVPETVLNSKCIEILRRTERYGIMELYLYDEKAGIKAYCKGQKIQRY